jgi:carbon monoxide dehydrogenase subunit G
MKIEHEFTVARPPDDVWRLFQDVPSVAQCLPGAELTGQGDDGSYDGKLSVKLGPMAASRGQVKVSYSVVPEGSGSRVTVDADVTLAGQVAQFGRTGLINEMSKRLIGEFVDCLEAKLAAETPVEASGIEAGEVRGLSLFFSSLWAWIKRLFGRGEQ